LPFEQATFRVARSALKRVHALVSRRNMVVMAMLWRRRRWQHRLSIQQIQYL